MQFASFIKGLPKAELHVHIEGTLEPELMFKLAKRNGITPGSKEFPFTTADEVRDAYKFSNLQEFLDIYYQGTNVLKTEQDFYDLGMAYFERAHENNVCHTEPFFDPQAHTSRGISYGTVIEGLSSAARDAEKEFGISSFYIHSFLRNLSEESAFDSLKMAEPYLHNDRYKIIGVGLDSNEIGNPPEKFARVYARAKELKLKTGTHICEEGPPEYGRQALDILGIDRGDHGNRLLEDSALTQRFVDAGITLTVCPLSNYKLKNVPDLTKHQIPRMLALGLKATINSDDPAYFGGYINDNFLALANLSLINHQDCATLARNSVAGSFLDDARKQALQNRITEYTAYDSMKRISQLKHDALRHG